MFEILLVNFIECPPPSEFEAPSSANPPMIISLN